MKAPNNSQQGVILLAIVLVLILSGSTFLLAALNNRQTANLAAQQELRYQMEQAKAALLAYAANSAALLGNLRGPGYLPCPDTTASDPDNDGIISDSFNTVCSSTLGRLPEAVDVGGARFPINNYYADADRQFWYAVGARYTNTSGSTSSSTRQAQRRTSTTLANATNFRLNLDGTSGYAALIIAPGEALADQNRTSGSNAYTNYLDYSNGQSRDYVTLYPSNPSLFNDQILGITLDEYMQVVGMALATSIRAELNEAASYPASQSSFRTAFNYSSSDPADMPIWLRNTSSTTYGNGERWPFYTNYSRVNADEATIVFQGCAGITFTIRRTDSPGLTRNGDSC